MATVYVKQNDTLPSINATIKDDNSTVIDLTGATVKFFMNDSTGTNKVDGTGELVVAASGTVKYDWVTGDLDTVGIYSAEFQITFIGGTILTAPSSGYITIVVGDDLK